MKTFDTLEIGDLVYSASFLWGNYVMVLIRKVEKMYKSQDGKLLSAHFSDGTYIATRFINTDRETIDIQHTTNVRCFIDLYINALKRAKQSGKQRALNLRQYMRVIENIREYDRQVKDAVYKGSPLSIEKSIYGR